MSNTDLEMAIAERDVAQARALKYEQALREIVRQWEIAHRVSCTEQGAKMVAVAHAALDKPGTEVENLANEVENSMTKGLWKQVFDLDRS